MVDLQSYLLIPRIIEASMFFVILLLTNRQFSKTPFLKRPLIHKLFFAGIFGWFLYIFMDIFIYSLGGLSFDPMKITTQSGYTIDYPSLFFVNILRDIAMFGVSMEAWCYFLTPVAIKHGEKKTTKLTHNPFLFLLVFGWTIIMIIYDRIQVVTNGYDILVNPIFDGFEAIFYCLSVFLYMTAAIYLRIILKESLKEDQSNISNKIDPYRINCFSWGILFKGLGYIWAVLMNILAVTYTVLYELPYFLTISIILHGFWMISPILIYLGLKRE